MTSNLFRPGNWTRMPVPAPRGMMNDSVAPQAMSGEFAQYAENMLPLKSRVIAKRYGLGRTSMTGIPNTEKMTWMDSLIKPDGTFVLVTGTDAGKLYVSDVALTAWTNIKSGLSTNGRLRSTTADEKLIIVNGVDTPMYYDGTSVVTISELVKESSLVKTWVDSDTLTIDTIARGSMDYPNGRTIKVTFSGTGLSITSLTRSGSTVTATTAVNHNLLSGTIATVAGATQPEYNGTGPITVTGPNTFTYTIVGTPISPATGTITYSFTGVSRTTTVSTTSLSGTILTVNLATNIFPAASVTIDNVQYTDSPPAFSYIKQMHDRLWALGPGILHADDFRASDDRMLVYYTDSTNSATAWFTQSGAGAQTIPYINFALKHEINDEIVGFDTIDSYTVFFGRRASQLWSGVQPQGVDVDFAWLKTIPVGALSGDLIQKHEDDLLFVNRNGVRNFKTVAVTDNVKTSQEKGQNIKNTAFDEIQTTLDDDTRYREARAFSYAHGNLVGFGLGDKALTYFQEYKDDGWAVFTGLFGKARAIHDAPNGRLYMAYENQLFYYGDKEALFSDDGQNILTVWWTPWLTSRSARWSNRYIELETNPGAVMDITVRRFKNNDTGFYNELTMQTKSGSSYWDSDFWDVAFWDSIAENKFSREEDKYIAYNMSYAISTNTKEGPFEIVALNLFGKLES